MTAQLIAFACVFFIKLIYASAKEDELPLCPTNVNYFPQTLPMHCRMPRSANYPMMPGLLPNLTFPPLPPLYQNVPSDKQPAPMPFPVPPGFPGPAPMPMHVPMMPMQPQGPAHKLPVIVMPFYSPDTGKSTSDIRHHRQKERRIHVNKKRLPHYYSETDTDTDTSETDTSGDTLSDTSSSESENGWWKGRKSGRRMSGKHRPKQKKHKKNKEFLTPILQYVTKDGYVIFEKKISKNQASDWLQEKKEDNDREYNDPPREANNPRDEEGEAAHEVDNVTKEFVQNRGTGTKVIEVTDKENGRPHKNVHRHKVKNHQGTKLNMTVYVNNLKLL